MHNTKTRMRQIRDYRRSLLATIKSIIEMCLFFIFRISVRRPLNLETEEHIYAEIEPLQVGVIYNLK